MPIRRLSALLLVLGLLVPAQTAAAYPRPGSTELVSRDTSGAEGHGWSWLPDISHDGRFIVYQSDAPDLVPDDTNAVPDVFWHDRATGETRRASVRADGAQEPQGGNRPAVSDDGRYVAFYSWATALVPGDTNPWADCFVKDMQTGSVELVTVAHDGGATDGGCFSLQMDATGRFIVFESYGTNIVPGDTNDVADIFVRDRVKGETRRVSIASDGTQANDHSIADPVISADGRVAAFYSTATNLTDDPTHSAGYIYTHDLETGVTERVAKASDGTISNGGSIFKAISGDGRYVAFASGSTNLVPNDTNVSSDIFVHDRVTKETRRVNVSSSGGQSEVRTLAYTPTLSHDGRFVGFITKANNLVEDDTNEKDDAFVHDMLTGETELISVDHAGGPAGEDVTGRYNPNEITGTVVISGDGRHVVFSSQATDLLEEPTTAWRGIFIRDRGHSPGIRSLSVVRDGPSLEARGAATFGGYVAAAATDPGDDASDHVAAAGGEIVGGELVSRTEGEDLLVRIHLESLPGFRAPVLDESRGSLIPSAAGLPVVTYGFRFSLSSSLYEARAVAAPSAEGTVHSFALYRCTDTCERIATLQGGIGVIAPTVTMAIPRAQLPAGALALSQVNLFADIGAEDVRSPGDALALPDRLVEDPTVRAWVAGGSGAEPREVPADLLEGRFVASTEVAEGARLIVEACLGGRCGSRQVEA